MERHYNESASSMDIQFIRKERFCNLKQGQKFFMLGTAFIIKKIVDGRVLFRTLTSHGNDAGYNYGSNNQQWVDLIK